MKLLYMLKKQYSRFCLREMVVVAQIVLIVLLFTPILSKLDRLLSIDQLAKNIQGPALFFQADDYYFMPEFLDAQEYTEAPSPLMAKVLRCISITMLYSSTFDCKRLITNQRTTRFQC